MPIQTTANDVVFCGHGTYMGGGQTFNLPNGVELWITQPVGSAMTDGPVTALVAQRPIDRLIVRQPGRGGAVDDLAALQLPTIYRGPNPAPNLVLHDLGDLRNMITAALPLGPHHVITVARDTTLQDLLARDDVRPLIALHAAMHTHLRVFWAACSAASDDPNDPPSIYHNAKAVFFALSNHATQTRTDAAINAAQAAHAHATANPEDTAGTVAAAVAHDPAAANILQAI